MPSVVGSGMPRGRLRARASWFKKRSSVPNTVAGRTMVASGNSSSTAFSPSALCREGSRGAEGGRAGDGRQGGGEHGGEGTIKTMQHDRREAPADRRDKRAHLTLLRRKALGLDSAAPRAETWIKCLTPAACSVCVCLAWIRNHLFRAGPPTLALPPSDMSSRC